MGYFEGVPFSPFVGLPKNWISEVLLGVHTSVIL